MRVKRDRGRKKRTYACERHDSRHEEWRAEIELMVDQIRQKKVAINTTKDGMVGLKVMGQDRGGELITDWNRGPVFDAEPIQPGITIVAVLDRPGNR